MGKGPSRSRRGARSPRCVASRSSSAVHVRPSRVCLWRTRLRAEHSAAAALGGGREGGGTAAGAGAANLASRPRRGPGVTGAPPRRCLQGLSQERPARSRPRGSCAAGVVGGFPKRSKTLFPPRRRKRRHPRQRAVRRRGSGRAKAGLQIWAAAGPSRRGDVTASGQAGRRWQDPSSCPYPAPKPGFGSCGPHPETPAAGEGQESGFSDATGLLNSAEGTWDSYSPRLMSTPRFWRSCQL
ncbi:uncharacterized protein LOC123575997 [Leopardus geoffroyi]|uniref:uncharacterized protein LOC123575997 n=1 Tax=Leopardus geoffroyi TaxID=46844 RepID=UPI001E264E6A|nr:uncharacterized protein LOC123575997 [Leopardus geoffroyi]